MQQEDACMHDDKNHNTAKRLQQHMIIAKQVAVLLNIHCHSLATHSLLNESICTYRQPITCCRHVSVCVLYS